MYCINFNKTTHHRLLNQKHHSKTISTKNKQTKKQQHYNDDKVRANFFITNNSYCQINWQMSVRSMRYRK